MQHRWVTSAPAVPTHARHGAWKDRWFGVSAATAILLLSALLAATPVIADIPDPPKFFTYRNSACTVLEDPVNVLFFGSAATAENAFFHVTDHTPMRTQAGSTAYMSTHGQCAPMKRTLKSSGSPDYHVRLFNNIRNSQLDPYKPGLAASFAPVHHERAPCDAVFQHDPDDTSTTDPSKKRSGFDQAAAQMVGWFHAVGGHYLKRVDRVPNTQRFNQPCTGERPGWNGRVLWFNIGSTKPRSGS